MQESSSERDYQTTAPASVAILAPTWGSPSETFIRDHIGSLQRYRPVVLTWKVLNSSIPPEAPLYHPFACWNAMRALGALQVRLRLPWRSHWRLLAQPCRRHQACLLHVHFADAASEALTIANAVGIPLVLSCHGTDVFVDMQHPPLANLRKRIFAGVSRIIVHSDAVRNRLVEYGADPAKITKLHLGIDPAKFTPSFGDSSGPVRVLCIARFVGFKGHRFLLPAFQQALQQYPDMQLVLIGDGPLRPQVEQQVDQLGLRSAVQFLGALTGQAVLDELARAHIFALPSVTCPDGSREGFGVVFLEAQAMAKPVIGSRCGGIPEAIADGETGFLVEERDSAALAEKLVLLAQDPDLRARLGTAGRLRIQNHFNIYKQAALLEEMYSEIIAAHQQGSRA